MKLLQEIRSQPEHIRHIMMWLCVVTTFSLVALVWFRTTETRLVAMLHPRERLEEPVADHFANRDVRKLEEERILAQKKDNNPSPLASIWHSFQTLKASIGELLGSNQEVSQPPGKKVDNQTLNRNPGKALPLSRDK